MPVIPAISQGIKIGMDFTPAADPNAVSVIKGISQACMSSTALMPGVPPIPVIPAGTAIAIAMSLLEALINYFIKAIEKQCQILMRNYNTAFTKATSTRDAASLKLFNDLIIAQKKMKDDLAVLQAKVDKLNKEIGVITKKQTSERAKYDAAIFSYKEMAKKADETGDQATKDKAITNIALLDPWIKEIMLMTVEIVNRQIEIKFTQIDINKMLPLTNINITNTWDLMANTWANKFEVAVPYYPDLPDKPTLPKVPKMPKEPDSIRVARQMLAKWLTAPMVPPIALVISGLFETLRQQATTLPPPVAAQLESMADGLILQLGLCF